MHVGIMITFDADNVRHSTQHHYIQSQCT